MMRYSDGCSYFVSFFKQTTAYELRISDWSSDVCSSDLDHRAEEIIFNELSRARPGYGFLMEERGEVKGADATHRFIVDPLDGTTNFQIGRASCRERVCPYV